MAPRTLPAVWALLAVLSAGDTLAAQTGEQRGEVLAAQANLRVAPAIDARINVVLPRGATVIVLETQESWARVRVESSGREGWLRVSQMRAVQPPPRPDPAPDLIPEAVPKRPAAVRDNGARVFLLAGISAAGATWQVDGTTGHFGGRKGLTAGAGVEVAHASVLGIEGQLSWIQAGYATRSGTHATDHRVGYIRATVAGRWRPFGRGLSFLAGPFLGYPISCRVATSNTAAMEETECASLPEGKSLTGWDLGASAGVALELRNFRLIARYDHSLSDRLASESTLQNRGLQVVFAIGL